MKRMDISTLINHKENYYWSITIDDNLLCGAILPHGSIEIIISEKEAIVRTIQAATIYLTLNKHEQIYSANTVEYYELCELDKHIRMYLDEFETFDYQIQYEYDLKENVMEFIRATGLNEKPDQFTGSVGYKS